MGNLSLGGARRQRDAIAYAMLTLAYSTEDVNGVPGRAGCPAAGRWTCPTSRPVRKAPSVPTAADQHDHARPGA